MLTLSVLQTLLGWCTVINFTVLSVWFVLWVIAREQIYALHQRWFPALSKAQFEALHYNGMALFKLAIMLFNLAPYVALLLMS